MANIYDMVDTWNDGATTFTSIKMNVTDTASDAASLLMDLQVGGSSKFSVAKSGNILFTGSKIQSSTDIAIFGGTGGGLSVDIGGVGSVATIPFKVAYSSLTISQRVSLGWTAGSAINTGTDLVILRDAAGTLAQRNSTNAQTFNLYNTYTDASNYERGFLKWNSNVLEIGAEAAGTGTGRVVKLSAASTLNASGQSIFLRYNPSYEIRIYEGTTTRWRFASTHFRPEADNTNDIGLTGTRIRTLYTGTSVETPRLEVDTDFTVATLPTPTVGMMARVTDGDSGLTFGNTVVNSGAGATPYLVWYNGTNWTVIGA